MAKSKNKKNSNYKPTRRNDPDYYEDPDLFDDYEADDEEEEAKALGEPLYVTKTVWTYELFHEFIKNAQLRVNQMLPQMILLTIFMAGTGIFLTLRQHYFVGLGFLFIILVYTTGYFKAVDRSARRIYEANPIMQDAEVTYEFYPDRCIARAVTGVTELFYKDNYCAMEHNGIFYLMTTHSSGFAFLQENCSKELWNFLGKVKEKYPGLRKPFWKQEWQ